MGFAMLALAPVVSRASDGYTHYIGALHEHSGYSDGWPGSTPADYFASANGHGIDFLGSGEHSDSADVPTVFSEECLDPEIAECAVADQETPADSLRKWDATLEDARAASDADFTGFRGFEWTSDRFGHINVYFSRHDTNAKIDGGYAAMETFWQWFRTRPSLGGGADGLATFNHPDSKNLDDADLLRNWNDFAYVPDADARMVGIEVYNDNRDYGSRGPAEGWYAYALDKGWHVGAIGAEDLGHDPDDDWGAPSEPKTVLIAVDRSEGALREAMLARRMYAVQGGHTDVRIELSADGEPMGARLAPAPDQPVTIAASVAGAGVARLELVTNGGTIVAAANGSAIERTVMPELDERYYFLRVLAADGNRIATSSPVWVRAGLDFEPLGEWVAGDLHIHTTYSHDSYGGPTDDNTGPDELYTLGNTVQGQFAVASSRGLDFLAITDHNDIRSQTDPGFGAFGVIPVHGYEGSFGGHAQMLGARVCYHPEGPQDPEQLTNCNNFPDKTTARLDQVADLLRADGGVFQLNHPADDEAGHPLADWYTDHGFDLVPDTIEVWNISPLWQAPAPSGHSYDDALSYWHGFLDRGYRVGATGGSDNHYLSTTVVQGAGQPTTWVWVNERSERGILEGLRGGRTFVSFQPPVLGGPRLYLEADGDDDGVFESMVGDDVPTGAPMRVRFEGAAPLAMVRVVTDGGTELLPPTPAVGEISFTAPVGTWVHAELVAPDLAAERATACDGAFGDQTTYCRNRLAILALTSPIFVS